MRDRQSSAGVSGRLLYFLAFCLVLPASLIWWAWAIEPAILLPPVHIAWAGASAVCCGLVHIISGWWALWSHGGGLPMNAYPTVRLVHSGVYRVLDHPVYVGAVLLSAGVSLWVGSAAGLWVISPTLACACVALVWGYERDATKARLGEPAASMNTWLSVPRDDPAVAGVLQRLGVAAAVLVPWLVLYEMVGHLPARTAASTWLSWERHADVHVWAEALYASVYVATPCAVLTCRTRRELRRWMLTALCATAVGIMAYIAVPVVALPRVFAGDGVLAAMLRWERADGLDGRAACPSFHMFWILITAWTFGRRGRSVAVAAWVWAAGATASCWLTGMHGVVDLGAGVALFGIAAARTSIWSALAHVAERIANSWREWRIGPVRIINHGIYAGIGAAVGVVVAVWAGGRELVLPLAIAAVTAMVGAGLFGQIMVGSKQLLRPFGYFGALLGGIAGIAACAAGGLAGWQLAAGLAVAAPWIQAIGRLRCLVQGCCHGRPTQAAEGVEGICYRHARSRVVRLSQLGGVALHPTPLYSIVGNVVIGTALARMCWEGCAAVLVAAGYLIGAGVLRFVEEHYRGEPHTRVVGGLRVYQWFALASVVTGIAVSGASISLGFGVDAMRAGLAGLGWPEVLLALGVGAGYFSAMGVDFPESSRRFSRLA